MSLVLDGNTDTVVSGYKKKKGGDKGGGAENRPKYIKYVNSQAYVNRKVVPYECVGNVVTLSFIKDLIIFLFGKACNMITFKMWH